MPSPTHISLPVLLQFECPESFQEAACAVSVSEDPASAAAACATHGSHCTGFTFLSGASVVHTDNDSHAGVLKDATGAIDPRHLTYSPFSVLFFKPSAAALPPLLTDTAAPNAGRPPRGLSSHRDASWSVLMRPDGELRTTQDGGKVWALCLLCPASEAPATCVHTLSFWLPAPLPCMQST